MPTYAILALAAVQMTAMLVVMLASSLDGYCRMFLGRRMRWSDLLGPPDPPLPKFRKLPPDYRRGLDL